MNPSPADPVPSLGRRFWRLTVVNILSNLAVPLAGLVDTAILGHLDDVRFLGGVALAAVMFDLVYWSFGFLRMGATGTTAQAWGSGDRPETYRTLYRTAFLAATAAAALLVLQVPLRELGFFVLPGEPGVEAAGRAYFDLRIWGAPATLVNMALIGWFLGREESGRVLAMTATANLVNIGLDWLFVVELGWNAAGAAAATALSQWAMLAVGLAFFAASGRPEPLRRATLFDRDALGNLLRLNRDLLVRTLCLVSSLALFTSLSASLGTAVLAANTILLRLQTFTSYGVDGVAYATESLAGILRGGGRRRELRRLDRLALRVGVFMPLPILAAVVFAPETIFGWLTVHREVIDLATTYGPWLVPVLLVGSVAFVYDGLFVGLTEGRALRNAMVISVLGFFLPPALAAALWGNNHLLWLAMALLMVARTVTLHRVKGEILDRIPATPPAG